MQACHSLILSFHVFILYWLLLVAEQSYENSFELKIAEQFDMDSKIEIDYRLKLKSMLLQFSKVKKKTCKVCN